jgi:hypothetical protein
MIKLQVLSFLFDVIEGTFGDVLSKATLLCRKLALPGTSHDICHTQGIHKRGGRCATIEILKISIC